MALAHEMGPYRVTAATEFGPRLLGFTRAGADNLFASLEGVTVESDTGVFNFHGGHRLWAAPEVPAVSYAPDDRPCRVEPGPDRLELEGLPDAVGLSKRITVAWHDDEVTVDHELTNHGPVPREVAPWAITQLELGGIAILPVGPTGQDQLVADRSLVLWPYTSLTDPRISWHEAAVTISAIAGPRLKVGTGPQPRCLGYLKDGRLFTKSVTAAGPDRYPDRGAVGQVFCATDFCELETAGPLQALAPGQTASHRETWSLRPCHDLADALDLMEESS